jgi:2-oxo-3-hexenedioate decarboxylase
MQALSPQQLLEHLDRNTYWPHASGLALQEAYEHQLAVRELRIARGEKPRGFKVGFTNRTIWERYGVYAPIWGTVYDTTLRFCEGAGELDIGGCSEPRLEPECVFGISATPPAQPSLDDLFACIQWVAPGFEVVQSHMPGWKFVAADTVADGGLHGRLLVGRKHAPLAIAKSAQELEAQLARASVTLMQGDEARDRGTGANVLDGPLHALLHFLNALRDCPGAPDLEPGDIVTTGTWTDAWPVKPGEQWRARFDAPLSDLEVRFQ